MGKGKPHGINAAYKLRINRRKKRWAEAQYINSHTGKAKHNPFGVAPCAAGIVIEKIAVEAKQPNSAIRKCVRVQLKKNNKKITAFVPRDGGLTFCEDNDEVLIQGFGRRGHAKGDMPGVRFKVVKVASVSLLALWKGKKDKPIK